MKQLKILLLSLTLFLPILLTGCSNDNFNFKNSELIDDCYTITVDNDVEEYSLIDDISVGKKQTWTVAKDEYGITTFTTKKVPLVIGDNYYYIIVFDKKDTSSLYKINIRRKHNLILEFKNSIFESIVISDFKDASFPTPEKENYIFNGWYYLGNLIDNSSLISNYYSSSQIILTPRFTPVIDLNDKISEYKFELKDVWGGAYYYPNHLGQGGREIPIININLLGNFANHAMSISFEFNYPYLESDYYYNQFIKNKAYISHIIQNDVQYNSQLFECIDANIEVIIIDDEPVSFYYDDWSIVVSIQEL